jgi:hypothetical protein
MKTKLKTFFIIFKAVLLTPFFVISAQEVAKPIYVIPSTVIEYVIKSVPNHPYFLTRDQSNIQEEVRLSHKNISSSWLESYKTRDPYEQIKNRFRKKRTDSTFNTSFYYPQFTVLLL